MWTDSDVCYRARVSVSRAGAHANACPLTISILTAVFCVASHSPRHPRRHLQRPNSSTRPNSRSSPTRTTLTYIRKAKASYSSNSEKSLKVRSPSPLFFVLFRSGTHTDAQTKTHVSTTSRRPFIDNTIFRCRSTTSSRCIRGCSGCWTPSWMGRRRAWLVHGDGLHVLPAGRGKTVRVSVWQESLGSLFPLC